MVHHIADRQSVRVFSEKMISSDILDNLLDAGIHSASGGNLQACSILVERDRKRCEKLGETVGYKFVAEASVNLIFLIDWHKLSIYAKASNAPFTANHSAFLMAGAWDETIMCAQIIETCAWIYGIGSCYVGHVHEKIDVLSEMYHLPDMTFPVIMLSLGYPKKLTPKREKLKKEMIVFEGRYPDFTEDEICRAYNEKYKDRSFSLPENEETRRTILSKFERALKTTYPRERVEEILHQCEETGRLSEIQRLFGLHYHAEDTRNSDIVKELKKQDLGQAF